MAPEVEQVEIAVPAVAVGKALIVIVRSAIAAQLPPLVVNLKMAIPL